MCDHFIGFQLHPPFRASRALWRCSSCGRESAGPIDCCTSPAFASVRRPATEGVFLRWLRGMRGRALMHLRGMRHCRPDRTVVMLPDDRDHVQETSDTSAVEPLAGVQRTHAPTSTETEVETTHVTV